MENLYTKWCVTHDRFLDYVLVFDIQLINGSSFEEESPIIGSAQVILTDEKWLTDPATDVSFVENVHFDFNDDKNWNELTPYEYLEDTLSSTRYGQEGGTYGKIARILKVNIDEAYRGNGYFHFLFERILDILKKFDVDFVALMPSPFGKGEEGVIRSIELGEPKEKDGERRLQTLYAKYGFKKCANKGIPYMTLHLSLDKNCINSQT